MSVPSSFLRSVQDDPWQLTRNDIIDLQNKNSEFCAPLTSFDWNDSDPKQLGTSSIDTTCTIWDIEVSMLSQLARTSASLIWISGSILDVSAARVIMRMCDSYFWCAHMQRGVVDTQLIAHDKEVYDIAWGGQGVFASVSADGSVRVFDLR